MTFPFLLLEKHPYFCTENVLIVRYRDFKNVEIPYKVGVNNWIVSLYETQTTNIPDERKTEQPHFTVSG